MIADLGSTTDYNGTTGNSQEVRPVLPLAAGFYLNNSHNAILNNFGTIQGRLVNHSTLDHFLDLLVSSKQAWYCDEQSYSEIVLEILQTYQFA